MATFLTLKMSPFHDADRREVYEDLCSRLIRLNVDANRCWTCFAWALDTANGNGRGKRTFYGRDELVLMLDEAVLWLRSQGYWWPMVAVIVKSPPNPARRRSGRWHVHIVEINGRQPSEAQRKLIWKALRAAGFSSVQLDDLDLSVSGESWWKPRKESKDHGHEGFLIYMAKNVAEHEADEPCAVYRSSNVPGERLPGEDVTQAILRAGRKRSKPVAPSPLAVSSIANAKVSSQPHPALVGHPAVPPERPMEIGAPLFPTAQKKASSAAPRSNPRTEVLNDVLLHEVEPFQRPYRDHLGRDREELRWHHPFEASDGRQYIWPASRRAIVEAPDGTLYPMLPGLRWNFVASMKKGFGRSPTRPKLIERPRSPGSRRLKILLTEQPEETRRTFARDFGFSLDELGLDDDQ